MTVQESEEPSAAKKDLQDLIVSMPTEEHDALKKLHLNKLPVDTMVFADLIKSLPKNIQEKYQPHIRTLRKINSRLWLEHKRQEAKDHNNKKSAEKEAKTTEQQSSTPHEISTQAICALLLLSSLTGRC
jgi:hypothetical protein